MFQCLAHISPLAGASGTSPVDVERFGCGQINAWLDNKFETYYTVRGPSDYDEVSISYGFHMTRFFHPLLPTSLHARGWVAILRMIWTELAVLSVTNNLGDFLSVGRYIGTRMGYPLIRLAGK